MVTIPTRMLQYKQNPAIFFDGVLNSKHEVFFLKYLNVYASLLPAQNHSFCEGWRESRPQCEFNRFNMGVLLISASQYEKKIFWKKKERYIQALSEEGFSSWFYEEHNVYTNQVKKGFQLMRSQIRAVEKETLLFPTNEKWILLDFLFYWGWTAKKISGTDYIQTSLRLRVLRNEF